MSLSNYLEGKFLNTLRGVSFSVANGSSYVKLHLSDPGEDGTSAPASNTVRKSVNWNAPVGNAMTNSAIITWTSVSHSETYTHVSLWDSSSGGNCLLVGALSQGKAVTAGDNASFPAGSLTFAVD